MFRIPTKAPPNAFAVQAPAKTESKGGSYDRYTYLWPPRPETAVESKLLGFYEKRGYVAQAKMNGTCNLIAVAPDRSLVCMNRHNDTHKLWSPTEASSAAFRAIPGKGWWVFVAELLHSKVPTIRDTNYVFDLLVADGEYLIGRSFAERIAMIPQALKLGETRDFYHEVTPNTWVARTLTGGFKATFDGLTAPEHEGLVLKQPKAPLIACGRPTVNAMWQVKCRRASANYGF